MRQSLKQIANYQYSSEAYLYKAKLESENIQVFLQNENTINIEPAWSNAIGGVKLFVIANDVIKAKQVLATISNYSVDENGKLITCPKCKAQKVELLTSISDLKSFLSFLFGLFLAIIPFYTKYKYHCESCKFEF